jgi:hypothetical protein
MLAFAALALSTSILGFGLRVQRMSDAKHSAPLGVVEVLDAQKNGDLEASGCTVDLKR